jgi:DNA-binding NarL/FixJ family response regulator
MGFTKRADRRGLRCDLLGKFAMSLAARSQLTPREREILDLIGKGMRNKEIAQLLFVSNSLMRCYVSKLLEKFEASNRTELVANAFRKGMLK